MAVIHARVWTGECGAPMGGSAGGERRHDPGRRRYRRHSEMDRAAHPRAGCARRHGDARASSIRTYTSSMAASSLRSVQLRDAREQRGVRGAASRPSPPPCRRGAWITGGDWDHQNWGGELPAAANGSTPHRRTSGVDQPPGRPHEPGEFSSPWLPRKSRKEHRERRRRRHRPRRRRVSRPASSRTTPKSLVDRAVPRATPRR